MKEKILEILNNNSGWMEHHSTDNLYVIESEKFDKIADDLVKLLIIGDVSNLLFCGICEEENEHRILPDGSLECEGCGNIAKTIVANNSIKRIKSQLTKRQ